jgi:integrase
MQLRSEPQVPSCGPDAAPEWTGTPPRRVHTLASEAGVRLPRMHPHMLRHTFVTTMLDAGVDLRDVQIAARHADPRTTMRYHRARKNLDRHPNYILAAYMASGT